MQILIQALLAKHTCLNIHLTILTEYFILQATYRAAVVEYAPIVYEFPSNQQVLENVKQYKKYISQAGQQVTVYTCEA